MAEELYISTENKSAKYDTLIPQIKALTEGEHNLVANLANIAAALRQTFGWFWVGFYLVEADELVLGPFQGDIACTRIAYNKGVCGKCWADKKSIIVPNVDEFPGHIACSAASKSEIVVPVINNNTVRLILDIDSDEINDFDTTDQTYLELIAEHIASIL
ncbi:MAG: GAF domain-containing protein [Putridiphycobacter sp.]|nr:GAF domain-containing protein [Putridiphycobacter sp.]